MTDTESERFPRRRRIRKRQEFHRVFAGGRRVFRPAFQVVLLENSLGYSRLGLAVGRRVGNAVVRNRVKRRLREIFRRNQRALPESSDVVVIARPPAADLDFLTMRDVLIEMLHVPD